MRRARIVLPATFSPKYVEREYLDKFPGWSHVEVTTGWLTARVGRPGRRGRAHPDRPGALLGLLPGARCCRGSTTT